MSVTSVLAQLGGIAPARDLASRGIGAGLVRTAWRAGELTRFRKGWYALPGLPPDVLKASRVGGVLCCISAARVHGLWTPNDDRLHVAVTRTASRLRRPEDHRIRLAGSGIDAGMRADADDGREVRVHWDGSARSSYERVEPLESAIERIIECCGDRTAFVVLESALNRGLLQDPATLERLSAESPLLRHADRFSESGLESSVRLDLIDARIPFRQQVSVPGCGRADFLIGRRLVIEADGREFHDPLADRRRDARFSIAGFRTLRFLTSQVLYEREMVMASIRAALARNDHL